MRSITDIDGLILYGKYKGIHIADMLSIDPDWVIQKSDDGWDIDERIITECLTIVEECNTFAHI